MHKAIIENQAGIQWLLNSGEPWTRYRTYLDLLDRPAADPDVQVAREGMVNHPQVQELITSAVSWPGYALKRHNDANHPLYALSTLADFGLRYDDPGLQLAIDRVLANQSAEGAFQTQIRLYPRFGGLDGEYWTWMACDAPTLTYALAAMGLAEDPQVQRAAQHLCTLAEDNGWRCQVAPELGGFRGPGRRDAPCPIANLYALKALSLKPEWRASEAVRQGAEVLLKSWAQEYEKKLYLFGTGTDFRKLKYPFVWYDILHVADVLSRFPFVHDDQRFREIVDAVTTQSDPDRRYTATSMYQAWKGWSFADKKRPSPWLTFLVRRIEKRITSL